MNSGNLSFSDIFQKSFLALASGATDRISPLEIVINLLISFAVGMFIFYIYKKTFQGILYQRSFNISLVISAMVTSVVIMTISGNLVLSLGMVGALSIVRFRTPIKDSMDLVFLFWAISTGIANGVGYYSISVISSISMGIILLALTNRKELNPTYMLVLQYPDNVDESSLLSSIENHVARWKTQSRVVTDRYSEITLEVRLHTADTGFLSELPKRFPGLKSTLVSYQADLASV